MELAIRHVNGTARIRGTASTQPCAAASISIQENDGEEMSARAVLQQDGSRSYINSAKFASTDASKLTLLHRAEPVYMAFTDAGRVRIVIAVEGTVGIVACIVGVGPGWTR